MDFSLREGRLADAEAAAKICYEAFKTISGQHNFPPDFGSSEEANELLVLALSHPDVHSVVAESAGRIVGSNFLWQREAVAAIGPVTVDPTFQNSTTVGRRLMEAGLEHARQKYFAGVRLVQAGYHNRSLALYAKLGFEIREPLANLQGPALRLEIPSHAVRPALGEDVNACNHLYHKIHGHDREKELRYAIRHRTAIVVEHDDRITGYATSIGFSGYAVGESNEDLKALIGAAEAYDGPGFLVPMRNGELFRWCLQHGLRMVQPMTLMSLGLYNQPSGAFLPSILY